MTMTVMQIERQDFVDNSIFELLQALNPTDRHFDWDIEMIGCVRDAVKNTLIRKTNCSDYEFYP
jgi:hypothetical protein